MSVERTLTIGLRFVVGLVLAGLAGLAALGLIAPFHPTPNGQGFDLRPPLETLGLGAFAAYAVAIAFGRPPWCRLLWSIRAALVFLAGLGWAYWRSATWREGLVCAGLVIAGLILHHIAHRHALGWIIDSTGERQKVDHLNRGQAIFTPTTRNQRLVEEATVKSQRRKDLAWALAFGGGLGYLAYSLYKPDQWGLAALAGSFGGLFLLFGVLPRLIGELFYQLGYQDMKGAKVLDPEPKRPGVEDVARQKAHGDASIAGEAEALNLLKPRG